MKALLIVLMSFLAFVGISGRSVSVEEECAEPIWGVVGRHYYPREACNITKHEAVLALKQSKLRQKYFKELSAGQDRPDVEKINKILDEMITLLPPHRAKSHVEDLTCIACSAGINSYRFLTNIGVKRERIFKILNRICVDFKIMTPEICSGSIDLFGETLTTVVDRSNSSSKVVCSILLNKKCGRQELPELQWDVVLPNTTKPPILKPVQPPKGAPKLKVLHISDTHWDTEYEVGSWAECKLPLCCRTENVLPDENATRAGIFGGWKCDTPEATFDSVLQDIAKRHKDIDYIIWTGDIPAHDIWKQSRGANLDVLKKTVAKLSLAFPKKPLFPALGNHESVPSNMFPTGKGSDENPMDWLFNEVNTQWSRWLPKNVSDTVRLGGFYTTLIRPGLRVISMNMNYCYKMNWWLVDDSIDPVNELQWLVQLLQEAENRKEKVHVIGHVPPGSSECIKTWQTNYYKIINRYENTVTAQFFGHTHSDEYEVFYDLDNPSRPFGVAYIGPSVTTYMYHNPSYRIYYVEGDYKGTNRFVLDHESWYLDLEEANREKRADWKKLYSAKSAYNLTSLFPEDLNKLYLRIRDSDEALQLYHKYYWNDSPKRPECGKKCRKDRLCEIRSCDQYGDPDN